MTPNPNDKVKIKITAETYGGCMGYGSGGDIVKRNYIGTYRNCLVKIASEHSYGDEDGKNENGEDQTCSELLNLIQDSNGDGCDYIFEMVLVHNGKETKLIENDMDFEEEDVEC